MKRLNKLLSIILTLSLILALAACGGESGGQAGGQDAAENSKPSITGAQDLVVEAGSSIDVLNGLTASDKEDGDLTAMITVESSPALTFSNGKATPETAGSYELVYSVTDEGGLVGEAYATLTVTRTTGEAVAYKTTAGQPMSVRAPTRPASSSRAHSSSRLPTPATATVQCVWSNPALRLKRATTASKSGSSPVLPPTPTS